MDRQYLNHMRNILRDGEDFEGRNGGYRSVFGGYNRYPEILYEFPVPTTRKFLMKSMVAELIGFLNGFTSAADFRAKGTHIWDVNANYVEPWLSSPHRKGTDDLGRIYPAQWRDWSTPVEEMDAESDQEWRVDSFDQILYILDLLKNGHDQRRAILLSWNPGEYLAGMQALPACHCLAQFSVREGGTALDCTMYQRSCDYPLGVPFNIASYSLLTHIFGRLAGLRPRHFHHMMGDMHIYHNQMPLAQVQISREPYPPPQLVMLPHLKTLKDFEKSEPDDYKLVGYNHHSHLNYPFSG